MSYWKLLMSADEAPAGAGIFVVYEQLGKPSFVRATATVKREVRKLAGREELVGCFVKVKASRHFGDWKAWKPRLVKALCKRGVKLKGSLIAAIQVSEKPVDQAHLERAKLIGLLIEKIGMDETIRLVKTTSKECLLSVCRQKLTAFVADQLLKELEG